MNDNFSELKNSERNDQSDNQAIVAGVFILIGALLLVNRLTDYAVHNWWALFMLIPAGAFLKSMWSDYQENGRLTRQSRGAIAPTFIILTMVAIFLFNLSWSIFWPVSLIAVGISTLLSNQRK